MIYLSGFQPLSIAKIKNFSSTTGVLQKNAILIEEVLVQTTLRDRASLLRLTSIIILRTKIFTSAFKFCAKYSHINLQCLGVKANL